jgi:hypothetical protein
LCGPAAESLQQRAIADQVAIGFALADAADIREYEQIDICIEIAWCLPCRLGANRLGLEAEIARYNRLDRFSVEPGRLESRDPSSVLKLT